MLYIDQPLQAGFSYDTLVESTYNALSGEILPVNESNPLPVNSTVWKGLLPRQGSQYLANTTALSARSVWHFMQVWVNDFPQYNTKDDRISIWGHSVSCLVDRNLKLTC